MKNIILTILFLIVSLCLAAQSSKKTIDSLRQVIKTAKYDTTRIYAYLKWGDEFILQNPDSSLALYFITKEIAEKLLAYHPPTNVADTTKKLLANALNNIGYIYNNRGDIPKALEFYNKSLKIREEIVDKQGMATSFGNIGNIYHNQGDIPKALKFYNKSLKIQEEIGDKKGMAVSIGNIGNIYHNQGDIPKSLEFYNKSLKINEEIGNKQGMAASFGSIGFIYSNQGDIPKALEFNNKSLKINEEIGDKNGMATSFSNIGNIYNNQGDIPKALDYYSKSLEIYEELGNKKGVANCFNSLGMIYNNYGDIPKALEYYNKCLKINEELGNKHGIAVSFNNIGYIYKNQGDIHKALDYHKKSLSIHEELENKSGMAIIFYNIGSINIDMGDLKTGNENILKALTYFEVIGDKKGMARSYSQLARISKMQGDVQSMKVYAIKGYTLSKELGYPETIQKAASMVKELMIMQGDYKKAFDYYEEEITMRDSLKNAEYFKETQKQQARYEYEKKATTDSIAHSKAMEIQNLEIAKQKAESRKQKIIIGFIVSGLLLILIFAAYIFRSLKITRKQKQTIEEQKHQVDEAYEELNQQNEEISSQRDEIEAQRDTVTLQKNQIEKIHHEVSQSIDYATRIQIAILPDPAILNQHISDHFVLFKPKDKVSGDFYWWAKVENHLIITVADCTGHGVPGAFMSMLGTSFLREIVIKEYMTNPAIILKRLRKEIIQALKQKGASGEQKDGMDMALVAINTETLEMQFAGANNPVYVIARYSQLADTKQSQNDKTKDCLDPRNDEYQFTELKGDKMPVAIYEKLYPFTNQEHKLQKGDIIYLMSDGYEDQFGGEKNKKFMSKNLKNLLAANSQQLMAEQKEILNNTIEDWMTGQEQIDDITVMGIRI